MKNKLFSLTSSDVVKGFIMAVLTVVVTALYNSLQSGSLPIEWAFWKTQLMLGLGAGVAYLLKNLFTNSNDQFLKSEPKNEAAN